MQSWQNTTKSKDSKEIDLAVANMQQAIMASLHHNVYNTSPHEQHKFCPVQWCTWQQDQENGTCLYNHALQQSKRLPETFLQHLIPLYSRLSDPKLPKRYIEGLTQNQNEALYSTVWQWCLKEKYFGAKSVNIALASAAMSWNIGKISQVRMYFHLLTKVPYKKTKAELQMQHVYL